MSSDNSTTAGAAMVHACPAMGLASMLRGGVEGYGDGIARRRGHA